MYTIKQVFKWSVVLKGQEEERGVSANLTRMDGYFVLSTAALFSAVHCK